MPIIPTTINKIKAMNKPISLSLSWNDEDIRDIIDQLGLDYDYEEMDQELINEIGRAVNLQFYNITFNCKLIRIENQAEIKVVPLTVSLAYRKEIDLQ